MKHKVRQAKQSAAHRAQPTARVFDANQLQQSHDHPQRRDELRGMGGWTLVSFHFALRSPFIVLFFLRTNNTPLMRKRPRHPDGA